MNARLALLADFANQSADGKLNILGAFDTIYAVKFPAVHPEMKLVVRFEIHPAEADEPRRLEIQFRNADGQKIFGLQGTMKFQGRPEGTPVGEMLSANHILGINALELKEPGRYEFVVLVNGEIKASVPLKAVVRPSQ